MDRKDYYENGEGQIEDYILSKEEIESCRHKSEKRWYRGLCVLNVLIALVFVAIVVAFAPRQYRSFTKQVNEAVEEITTILNEETNGTEQGEKKAEDNKKENVKSTKEKETKEEKNKKKEAEQDSNETEEEDTVSAEETDIFLYAVAALAMFLLVPLILNLYYQQYRTMSIRITPKNFPEIYERVELYAKRLGMKKVPEVYIIQQNGILNAFSSFIIRKQYIEIYADIFEVAYREHEDLDTISFIIAHEMAHIQYKHATFGYYIKIMFSSLIPILGSTASRAREYSCDRLAQKVTGNDGIEAMFSLIAGKHLYKMVDKEDYLEYAKSVKGIFVWWYNLLADHPVMTKRIPALEMKEGSGKLY